MRRRDATHVASILILGLVIRALAFDYVGIWLDYGFYAYDTRLILRGAVPFVDFLGRSPLYLYLLAGWRALVGYSPLTFRAFNQFFWGLTALPVYGLAREIRDHRTGLVAVGAFWLVPYGWIYGFWTNTMSVAALCATSAVYLVVAHDRWWAWPTAGVLVAAAFLSRRSAIVVLGALGLVVLVDWLADRTDLRTMLVRGTALSAAFAVTLGVGYALVVGAQWPALYEIHALNLFLTTGRGGWPVIGTSFATPGNSIDSGRIPIFNDVCQLCGRWTARTLAKGLLVTVPVAGVVGATTLRYATRRWFDPERVPYLFAPLAVLGAYAAVLAAMAGFWTRLATILALALFVLVAYRADIPSPRIHEHRALTAVTLVASLTIAGYLYRERVLHVYYGMDLWPTLSVLAGVAGVTLWRRLQRPGRAALVLALVIAIVTSSVAAYPLSNIVLNDNSAGWFTPDNSAAISAEVDARTEDGDIVLAKTATYVAGTHAEMPLHDSRSTAHFYSTFQDTGPTKRLYQNLSVGMATGKVALVVRDPLISRLLADNETTRRLFEENYCRVDDPQTTRVFATTNTTLYEYDPSCPSARQPQVHAR